MRLKIVCAFIVTTLIFIYKVWNYGIVDKYRGKWLNHISSDFDDFGIFFLPIFICVLNTKSLYVDNFIAYFFIFTTASHTFFILPDLFSVSLEFAHSVE